MLTTSERIQVEQALTVVLAREGNPKSLIEVILGKNADPILITLAIAQPAEIARRTVDECLRSRWKLDPSLLGLLLQDLVNNRGAGALNDILKRARKHIDPNPDPYEDTWLGGRRPFVDRQSFRSSVQSLIDDYTWPVLRVSAAADSFGRTYSLHYLRHLQKQLPHTVTMLSVELSPGTGPSYQVGDLLETVRSQLGIREKVQQRTKSGYPLAAARWMLRHMMASPGQWLLVLDGFGQAGLNDEVGEMIEALAGLVPIGTFPRRGDMQVTGPILASCPRSTTWPGQKNRAITSRNSCQVTSWRRHAISLARRSTG